MTGNRAMAEQFLDESAQLAARRRALLAAACCLNTTATLGGALRALGEWDGPDAIRKDAAAILEALDVTDQRAS